VRQRPEPPQEQQPGLLAQAQGQLQAQAALPPQGPEQVQA